jgi:hypothetical protein
LSLHDLNTREGTSVPDEEDDESSDEDGRLAHLSALHFPDLSNDLFISNQVQTVPKKPMMIVVCNQLNGKKILWTILIYQTICNE